ncbi:hypothetical protein RB594_001766 [Gaeumannomyces avenae]
MSGSESDGEASVSSRQASERGESIAAEHTDSPSPIANAAEDAAAGKVAKSPGSKKRKESTSTVAGDSGEPAAKITKRRAARACVSCRARKVRCDVVEGAPCGNCRWDNVECIVQESRRRKKNIFAASSSGGAALATSAEALRAKTPAANPINITSADLRRPSEEGVAISTSIGSGNDAQNGTAAAATLLDHTPVDGHGHVPHLIYQQRPGFRPENSAELLSKLGDSINNPRMLWPDPPLNPNNLFGDIRTAQFLSSLEEPDLSLYSQLPAFVKPLPGKLTSDDVKYLHAKGALSLPELGLQNALLQAYVEFVHPYMPLIELHDFLNAIHSRDGLCGQISLFLYHAVMFAATAFVDIRHLQEAGYPTRKAARKFYFAKTRLLYDFDYESDRLVLVQALLLMTYWYETPDDQKDTWHWMGVAISLAHTIGLHRNPGNTNMAPRKQRLWKRIWWSCFMRDRLVALGMRRPTRIKDEDFDVPMLVETDFELEALSDENQLLSADCAVVRDLGMQRELAELCIQKAKLCVLISRMLKAQYSVLIRDATKPENTTNSTMMLFPNKTLDNLDSINVVDLELTGWLEALPPAAQYHPLTPLDVQQGRSTVAVQRSLLHMVYYTTVSALHRPQFLPASPFQVPTASHQVQDMSRLRVRESAARITHMASELHQLRLERFLPTTGVTVILPAMIIHLLEMKNPMMEVRATATKGFRQLLRVMEKLRDIYSAADFATVFLDAALRKAAIDLNQPNPVGAAETLSTIMANGGGGHRQRQQQMQQQQQFKRQLFQQRQSHHYGQKPSLRNKPATIAPALNLAGAAALRREMGGACDELSTPPPENAPYINQIEMGLFHGERSYNNTVPQQQQQKQQPHQQPVGSGSLGNNIDPAALAADVVAAAAAAGHSPPHTERDLDSAVGLTPSASGGSSGDGEHVGFDTMDVVDFGSGHDEFDWNAVTGTNLDFDQWLQFPPAEGSGGVGADGCHEGNNGGGADAAEAQATAEHTGDVDADPIHELMLVDSLSADAGAQPIAASA